MQRLNICLKDRTFGWYGDHTDDGQDQDQDQVTGHINMVTVTHHTHICRTVLNKCHRQSPIQCTKLCSRKKYGQQCKWSGNQH